MRHSEPWALTSAVADNGRTGQEHPRRIARVLAFLVSDDADHMRSAIFTRSPGPAGSICRDAGGETAAHFLAVRTCGGLQMDVHRRCGRSAIALANGLQDRCVLCCGHG